MPAIYRNGTRYGNAPTSYPAENVAYDPTTSNLPATNAQNAIDELADATPRIASAGPASVVVFNTDTVAPFQEIKCSVTAIQEGTPWIDSNVIEKEPYNFRKVAGTASRIGNHLFDKLVGGTVAWNQLVQNGNFVDSSHWSKTANTFDYVFANNTVTLSATTTLTRWNGIQNSSIDSAAVGHKLLIHATTKAEHGIVEIGANATTPTPQYNVSAGEWYESYALLRIDESSQPHFFQIRFGTSYSEYQIGESITAKNAYAVDLTAMFGSTIADYIYSLEQATAGSGVNFFRKLFPDSYYAYDAGSLKSVKTTAHVMRGFNQWDEVTQSGYWNGTTGIFVSNPNELASINFIPVTPNTTYYFKKPTGQTTGDAVYFNKNKEYISYNGGLGNRTFTTPANCYYIQINLGNNYGTAYNNDICINISDTNRNGEYEPYIEHNYALDDVELRGLFKLDSNNKLYADGDTYESSGDVGRKYGIVNLGSLSWGYQAGYFYASVSGIKQTTSTSQMPNLLADNYVTVTQSTWSTSKPCITIISNSSNILVGDDNYNDKDVFKAAMSGHYLIYELATATTETADPFTNPQQVDANGTEEYIDSRSPAIPVGHETYYADIYDITGFTSCKVSVKDGSNVEQKSATISFGQTVYGGYLEYKNGAWSFTGTHMVTDLTDMEQSTIGGVIVFTKTISNAKLPASNADIAEIVSEAYTPIRYNGVTANVDTIALSMAGLLVVNTGSSTPPIGKCKFMLAEPFTLTLTGNQLETLLGENRVSHNCNGDIEVKYYTSGASIIKDLIDATPIDDLANVSISSPANNQILTYNSTTSKWENKAPVVDSSLSSTSTNPVQNKVINTALDGKADKATTYTKTEVDDKFEDIKPIGTATGNPCSFETDAALPLASLKASIVTTGGNGSPDSPNPIVGHSELNLVRCGKNFVALNASPYQSAVNTEVSVNSESTDLLSITSSAVPYACRQLYYKLPAGTYTVSLGETTKTGTDNPVISIYDYPNGTLIVNALSANNNVVFTLSDETVLDIRLFATGNTAEVNTVTFNDFQIELGSSSSPYAPYNGQTFTVSFGQTVYGGAYDANRGKVRITNKEFVINENFNPYSGFPNADNTARIFQIQISDMVVGSDTTPLISDICKIETATQMYTDNDYIVAPVNGNNAIAMMIKDTTTGADARTWLADHNITVVYPLVTPIEIDVSELSVDTIVGVNNIVSDCGGDITVEYLKNADMAEFVETIHNSLSPIILTGTLNAGETSITFSSDAITEDSLIDIYTDPNIFYTGTTTSDGEIEITFPERQYNVSVKVRII